MAKRREMKLKKTEKETRKKEIAVLNSTDKSDFKENEIPNLNSLKPFEFEPKANIEGINFSSSDDEEEGIEDKVKRIGNSEWCECSKQCKPMKTYTESLCYREGNHIPERYLEG